MTLAVGRTIAGTGHSSSNRPSSVPVVTASISAPVNSEQRAADPQISSESFPMAAKSSPNAELSRVEESAVFPRTSGRATLPSSADISASGSRGFPTPNYQSVIFTPSQQRSQMAAIPSPNAEFPRVEVSAVAPRTSARATLQTASPADLPASGSHATPTPNYQSVVLTPSQLSVQTLSIAPRPGAGSEQRRPAPHLRPFRPLPTKNSSNPRPL
ncbi:unnamed protein product [Withania somnifera]